MCTKIINFFFFIYFLVGIVWIFSPLCVKEFSLIRRDGSLVIYQNNVLNSFLSFIPISIYEQIFPIVYLLEAIELIHIIFDIVFYYTIVVQFCWMLSAQLKVMAFKCESLGNEILELRQRKNSNYMKYLNQILLDYTKLNVSIRKFYEIMKPMTWFTYVYYFNLFNALTYMCIMNYFKNDCELSVNFARLLIATLAVSIDLFIMCYYYSYLENQIIGIQFALYCIDWTEKSIKFKQKLLLAMSLNNTNRLKMNITPRKSLNLEVFGSALRVSYSIISLLVKKTIS
ncbi:odorant receptor 23a [Daktulosphaira vitifoliae]|uniref:odorant receptor 23a n=1 Tax=Daktulosphaira vitifoliae TaxID=58002 RepID=UPI0021AA0A9E|nr:odorant receptor 23a [Daktulosphaira vitifoliae]